MNRIISKEEEREDPRRELQSSFQLESKSVSSVSTCNPATPSFHKLILYTELILPQEILQLQGSSHADYYKASSSNCSPCIQAFYTAEHGSPTALQAHTAQAGFQLILPSRNSILSSSQHPQRPYKIPQAHSYRIIPGEIGFISKGLSIVYPCNTKVSVFQFTY